MIENSDKIPSKFFDSDDIKALKMTEEPVGKVLGMVNTWVYGLMIVSCLILISWVVFA